MFAEIALHLLVSIPGNNFEGNQHTKFHSLQDSSDTNNLDPVLKHPVLYINNN